MINSLCLLLSCFYPYRDLRNPPIKIDNNTRILVLCPPRSGSTLLYNVAQYLFEDSRPSIHYNETSKVIKLHNIKGLPTLPINTSFIIFTTIRDPIKIIQSLIRVGISPAHYVLDPISKLPFEAKTLTFQYEKMCNDNFSYMFDLIEDGLHIFLPEDEKAFIENHFNKMEMIKIQKKFKSFKKYDPVTGIHGKHIKKKSYSPEITLQLYEDTYELRKKWGYI